MSAHQGDSAPDVFVFPPFAPPARQDAPAPPAPPAPPETPEALAEPEPFGFEVPLPAHDVGDRETDAPVGGGPEALPWGAADEPAAPAAPSGDDLPWLEMPDGGPTIHATEEAPSAPEPPGMPAPTWMAWESDASSVGQTAAEITPPPLAAAGQLTSVSAVPAPSMDAAPATESAPPVEAFGFDAPDPYAPMTGAAHPETMGGEPAPAHSWPVEAMEPAALSADEAPVMEAPVLSEAAPVTAVVHPAFGELADRLEAMVRSLRNDPVGFVVAQHDDPLALLIAGYALGSRQGTSGR